MIKLISSNFDKLNELGIFPSLSFVIFFVFFAVVLIMTFRTKKMWTQYMSQLPLELSEEKKDLEDHLK